MNFLFFLSEHRCDFLTTFFSIITRFGEETIVILFLCFLFWCKNKNFAYKLCIGYLFAGLSVQGLKILFRIPRPWIINPDFKPVAAAVPKATGFSFPSGHTQNATTLFGFLGFTCKKWWGRSLCALMICLIGFSRMYLGVHTPKDVFVSFLISLGIIVCVTLFYHPETISKRNDQILSLSLLLFSIAVLTICLILFHNNLIEDRYLLDCIKAAGAGLGFSLAYYIERNYINFLTATTYFWQQLIKFVVGISTTVLLKEGIKLIFGTGFLISGLRYFIIIFWIIAIWPWIFMRLFHPSR